MNWLKGGSLALCALISALVASLWAVSYFRIPTLTFERVRLGRQTHYEARVWQGCVNFLSRRDGRYYYNPDTNLIGGWTFDLTPCRGRQPTAALMRHLGLVFPLTKGDVYRFPLWIPLLVAAAPLFIAWRRARRSPPGHCRKCRYNLTGNTSGICPECGTAIPNRAELS